MGIFCRPTSASSAARKPTTSVLWPTSRVASRVIVSTAPVACASSVSRSTIGHHALLVRDGDVGAQVLVAAQLVDRLRQVISGRRAARSERRCRLVERRLLEHARERVGDRMADENDCLGTLKTPCMIRPGQAGGRSPMLSSAARIGRGRIEA